MEELIPIFMFLCVAGVLILRPVTKKLGLLIEAVAQERMARVQTHSIRPVLSDEPHMERVAASLDRLSSRIDLIDDRMSFMERLVEDRPPARQRLSG